MRRGCSFKHTLRRGTCAIMDTENIGWCLRQFRSGHLSRRWFADMLWKFQRLGLKGDNRLYLTTIILRNRLSSISFEIPEPFTIRVNPDVRHEMKSRESDFKSLHLAAVLNAARVYGGIVFCLCEIYLLLYANDISQARK